jgi:hypothetical protein
MSGPMSRCVAWAAALVAGAAVPSALAAQNVASRDIAVVVNPHTAVDALSLDDLRRYFLGERQFWGDRTRVTLIVLPEGNPVRDVALRVVYRMGEGEYRQYWVAKIFRADVATGPKVVYSVEQGRRVVAATPGAILLLPADAVEQGLKVVRIDGHLPGEAGYPLH